MQALFKFFLLHVGRCPLFNKVALISENFQLHKYRPKSCCNCEGDKNPLPDLEEYTHT